MECHIFNIKRDYFLYLQYTCYIWLWTFIWGKLKIINYIKKANLYDVCSLFVTFNYSSLTLNNFVVYYFTLIMLLLVVHCQTGHILSQYIRVIQRSFISLPKAEMTMLGYPNLAGKTVIGNTVGNLIKLNRIALLSYRLYPWSVIAAVWWRIIQLPFRYSSCGPKKRYSWSTFFIWISSPKNWFIV